MLALILLAAGLALVFGAKDLAGRLAKGALGVVLVLLAIPCVIQSCVCSLRGKGADGLASALGDLSGLAFMVALAILGFGAWRRRTERARASELWAKRNGTPRSRALPTPPASGGGEGS
jgi:hypothetical protein